MSRQTDFLHEARARGFIHQVSDAEALAARLRAGPLTGYIGFDATADSLHVGSLVQIMLLRLLQRTGNRPLVLMGGGTTKIGDPSGKDEARQLLDEARIEANKAGIRQVFEPFLTFGTGPTDAFMLDNAEWLDRLLYIPFLREMGRHFSVNRMLSMESVRLRLEREQNLSFLEFNYMLLQAYDFLELHRRYGVELQMGGRDQWGNIVMGAELIRRVSALADTSTWGTDAHGTGPIGAGPRVIPNAFGLTTPLINTASGAKMGKTAQGAVWLNAERVSSYDYWQFWRNTEDADVGRFLGLFTELPMTDVARYAALQGAEINDAKETLATEATALLHGRVAAEAAAAGAKLIFTGTGAGMIGAPTISAIGVVGMPSLPNLSTPLPASVVDLLLSAKFVASKGEARRLIAQSGVKLNDAPVTDPAAQVTSADLRDGAAKLSLGKKKHLLVRAG